MKAWLADLILYAHFLYVLVVVLLVPLVIVGAVRKWRWIRSRRLRMTHLGMILFVVIETALGFVCPLTTWENALREASGESGYRESFIADWVSRLLFYEGEPWIFALAYFLFALLVGGLYFWVPPARRRE